jgi:D-alanyl-lipoteichoic acid acyltransferase DltB (MBOAT superfamily)
MYFAILTIEKLTGFEKKTEGKFNILKTIYTLLFVLIGWVIFRADSIGYAMQYIARMFTFTNLVNREFFYYLIENGVIFVLAIVLSTPIYKKAIEKLNSCILEDVILIILLIISVSYIVKGVYNPFIYFNF